MEVVEEACAPTGAAPLPYVDTRLYISVRPILEYTLPHAAGIIVRGLLGDVAADESFAALKECGAVLCPAHGKGLGDLAEEEDDIPEIRAAMVRTLAQVHSYLGLVSDAWKEKLRSLHGEVWRTVAQLKDERRAAYRRREATKDERGFEDEVERIRCSMDDFLHRIRREGNVYMERPKALDESCAALRGTFADCYGKAPTKRLLVLRSAFEYDLLLLQKKIADDFVLVVTRLLDEK